MTEEEKYAKPKGEHEQRPFHSVLAEHDLFASQRRSRRELLQRIEDANPGSAVIGFIGRGPIDQRDVPAFGDVLMSVGDVDTLNLIIDSPGGDGPTAEKLIELCRAYCKTFRVLIPNRAKSAATIIALGADEIVMGHCSELGPIDAQVPIVVGNIPRYISAQSFIDAQQELQAEFATRIGKDPKADVRDVLQQLASLDLPFIDHCKKLMAFSRDVTEKNLAAHMFKDVQPDEERVKRVGAVIMGLSQPANFQVHSRMIDGNAAKTRLGLNVKLLAKDHELWKAVWQYYIRADVFLSGAHGTPSSKVIESREESMYLKSGDD